MRNLAINGLLWTGGNDWPSIRPRKEAATEPAYLNVTTTVSTR
jgi:hypothetical protein